MLRILVGAASYYCYISWPYRAGQKLLGRRRPGWLSDDHGINWSGGDEIMNRTTRLAVLGLMLVCASALAGGPKRLKPEDRLACEQFAKTKFKEWRTADLSKIPPPNPDTVKLPYQLPISLVVYNHKGGFVHGAIDEDELAYHVEQARAVYQACGIEVVVSAVRYIEGPASMDNLERTDPDHPKTMSEQERCLFTPIHQPGMVNVYFVEEANNEHGSSVSHAYSNKAFMSQGEYANEKSRRFTGAAVIVDSSRNGGRGRQIVMPHEIGHIVLDASHTLDRKADLMNDDLGLTTLTLSKEQCTRARASPFVTLRASPDNFEAEAATRCDRNCSLELHEWSAKPTAICEGYENIQLKQLAFCDAEQKIVNPFAIANAPRKGTAACRYYYLKRASLEARKSKQHDDPTVAEGSGLFVYQDCRVAKKGPQEELMAALGETVYDYSVEAEKYCKLLAQ